MKTINVKKVLIALDYGPTAQKVSETGFSLAQSMNADVVLLHVLLDLASYSTTYMNIGPLQLDSAVELTDASRNFLEKTKRHLGDDNIQTLIKEGDFADTILETAKELHADVVVMGSHSRKWLENILMGSVTEKVLRQTTLPLFIVPTLKRNAI